MNKKKNLIFFLPNFSEGGAGKSILKICNNLNKKKYRIIIICIGKCYYKKQFKTNTKIYELENQKTLFSFFDISKILKRYFDKKNTIFISNINYANVLSCIFIKIFLRYKLVLVERTPLKELFTYYNFQEYLKKKIIYFLMKNLYKFSNLVIINSNYNHKKFKNKINCKSVNIFSPSIENVNLSKFRKKTKKLRILTIGRLSIEKRFDLLIQSITFLKNTDVKLHIIGNGPFRDKLNNLVKEKNLSKIIKISNFTKKYKKYYQKNNIFISTSDFGGFPNIVVEAMNNNLQIISRESGGGIHDILLNGRLGKIIDTNSPKEIAEEIIKFNNNISFYKKNRKLVRSNINKFTTVNTSKKFAKVFSKL